MCHRRTSNRFGSLTNLKVWWETIIKEGTKLGYLVNETKYWLIFKNEHDLDDARTNVNQSGIQITTSGKCPLGAAIGSDEFRIQYSAEKIK